MKSLMENMLVLFLSRSSIKSSSFSRMKLNGMKPFPASMKLVIISSPNKIG
ncbi:MAG: hypothetical protein ACTS73_06850 [Arsenophonus sp. NEOnobi-MAG3]